MYRTIAAIAALAVLALILAISLDREDSVVSGLLGPEEKTPEETTGVLVNPNTGAPVTLEAVQKDVDWHRETAEKLRSLH